MNRKLWGKKELCFYLSQDLISLNFYLLNPHIIYLRTII